MPTPTEIAVRTYEAAWQEHDPAIRARMIGACWAEDGRLVTRSTEIRGRAALAAAMTTFHADPLSPTPRITSIIDVHGSMFRFHAIAEHRDGSTSPVVFDAGHVDADGRIALILTFAGPFPA
jgi:hypothetical protein